MNVGHSCGLQGFDDSCPACKEIADRLQQDWDVRVVEDFRSQSRLTKFFKRLGVRSMVAILLITLPLWALYTRRDTLFVYEHLLMGWKEPGLW